MCLIAFAWRADPRYPLVLVANRDEAHTRPARALGCWPERPDLYAGRDEREGGTWLGLTRGGRLAAVTNVREAGRPGPFAASRGRLTLDFLGGTHSAADYADDLLRQPLPTGGYNLLVADRDALVYLSNRPQPRAQRLAAGVYGLSNAQLDSPWPKLVRSRGWLADWLRAGTADPDALLDLMEDRTPAADAALPDTGVGLDIERALSPAFITMPGYGTRCSSFVAVAADGSVRMIERRYDQAGRRNGSSEVSFALSGSAAEQG